MKKIVIALAALVMVGCISRPRALTTVTRSSVNERFDAVGALVVETEEGMRPYCSGVFVGSYMITAAHCVVEWADSTSIVSEVLVAMPRDFNDENPNFSKTWTFYPKLVWDIEDVALLVPEDEAARLRHGSVPVSTRNVVRGETVGAYGHPRGYLYYYSEGTVVTPLRYIDEQPFTLINAAGYPGMSGGPIFNEDGEVVGIVSFGWWGQSHIQGVATRESVERLIKTYNRHN